MGNLIYGIHAVNEAINQGEEIDKIFIKHDIKGDAGKELRERAKKLRIPVLRVPIEKINRMTNGNHQGIVAYIAEITYFNIEDLLPQIYDDGKTPLIILLDKITDTRNLGAIARSAECAGVNTIIIPAKGSALITSEAIKTSAGALYKIPVCRVQNLYDTVDYLLDYGLQLISATEKAEKTIYEVDFTVPTVIVVGNEEKGVTREILNKSSEKVKIPLVGEIESLNVSVASGIITFEALRQRNLVVK
jgi:23S rRNA (guanosine2251-2'-O)-methyltransferase